MSRIIPIFLIFLLASCSKIDQEDVVVLSGEVFLTESLIIEEDSRLEVRPGTKILMSKDVQLIAHGELSILGTERAPIEIRSLAHDGLHTVIVGKKSKRKLFQISHTVFTDGAIETFYKDVNLEEVHFENDIDLEWNDALARIWYGSLFMNRCSFNGNNTGEGLLVHSSENPVVQNSIFIEVPDAVEYLVCDGGMIHNNYFVDNSDDAIDLNNCQNIEITNNRIFGAKDRGMEIGSQGYGPSSQIQIKNNLIVGCKTGINIKEASEAKIQNVTFYQNKLALESINKENPDSKSLAWVSESVFSRNKNHFNTSSNAQIQFSSCMSDLISLDGTNCTVSQISFEDVEGENYTISSGTFPTGFDGKNIGYQK